MFFRRRRMGGGALFGTFLAILTVLILVVVLTAYVGTIVLIIFLCVGAAIGLCYALYMYIKSAVAVVPSRKNVTANGKLQTALLRVWTFIKSSSQLAFKNNIAKAKAMFAQANTCKWLSPRRWMWRMAGLSVIIFGSVMILAVALAIFLVACALVILTISVLVLCGLLLLASDLIYSLIMIFRNFGQSFFGRGNIFTSFDFSKAARFPSVPPAISSFFAILFSYCQGVWITSANSGKNNLLNSANYKLLSPRRIFLVVSVGTLYVVAAVFDVLMTLLFLIVFIVLTLVNVIWVIIATLAKLH